MDIKLVLFDLDGTLLPMNQDEFTKGYFKLLVNKLSPFGYDPEKLVESVWSGTSAMVKNNGEQSNEDAFWMRFCEIYGRKAADDRPLFEEFYRYEFQGAKELCRYNPKAGEAIRKIREMGIKVALATNPIFPETATVSRMAWAGLEPSDFEWYTTYENIGFCKPNPEYYRKIADRLDAKPEETLMVGNDVEEDMEAGIAAGMNVFLLTDCLINRERRALEMHPGQEAGDRYQEILANMIKDMQREIPDSGIYVWDNVAQEEGHLSVHTAQGTHIFFEKREEGPSLAEWVNDSVNGDVKSYGLGLVDRNY